MRTTLAAAALLLTTTALAACGGDDGDSVVTDPAAAADAPPPMPTRVPPADGPVRTLHLATVIDTGAGPPELCLGPVAESHPPQCSGPPVAGWDWRDTRGIFDRAGAVRWGTFAVTGRFDGEVLMVTGQVPGPLFDPPALAPTEPPAPAVGLSDEDLARVAEEVAALPGAVAARADAPRVTVEVEHDDGSLQEWADAAYGADVVHVVPLLVPAGG